MHSTSGGHARPRDIVRMAMITAAVVLVGGGTMAVLGWEPVYPALAAAGAVLAVALVSRGFRSVA
jgi:hypothetical protein